MRIVVFGANGPTGRQVVRQALAAGHDVVAVTRNPGGFPVTDPRLRVAEADAEVVISTFGVPYSAKVVTVYSRGIVNIIAGMNAREITRLVCVTSTSIAPGEAPGESWLWRKALVPLLRNVVGRTLYDDMQRMEKIVRDSDLDWTIVRPGGLFNTDDPTGDCIVSSSRLPGRMTSRADLAQTLVDEATQERHPRSVIEVITTSQLPPFAKFFKDAFGVNA